MRWLSFSILAYLILAIHLALTGFINWGKASPNLILPVVVFIAINASRERALSAAFLLGLCQDILSQQPLGLCAFAYGLVALFVIGAQPSVYRDHPLTHMAITLIAGLIAGAIFLFNDWAYPRLHHMANAPGPSVLEAIFGALYTALLSPLVLFPLVRLKPLFGFRPVRPNRSPGFARA